MIAQRIRHRDSKELSDGEIQHTPELVSQMFDEELDRILSELPVDSGEAAREKYRAAREISEWLIRNHEFDPI